MIEPPKEESKNEVKNFELLYSPRTEYSNQLEYEEKLFKDLTLNFDPITIKIIKKHFKERLGSLNKDEFVSILKNHLLSWHPKLPNREIALVKFLGRLFSEIDLNDNGSLEWAEFTNYIIHNTNDVSKGNSKTNNPAYRLRYYYPVKNFIDQNELKETVTYAFYIEKLNLIGIVNEGKSIINFFDVNTFKKLKSCVDLREIQTEIDIIEIKELDLKADELYAKELKEKREKIIQQMTHYNTSDEPIKTVYNVNRTYDRNWMLSEKNKKATGNFVIDKTFYRTKQNFRQSSQLKHLADMNEEISIKTNPYEKTTKNGKYSNSTLMKKKLTVVSTYFIPDYDLLLVAGTNNKICAWQYENGEFKNVNNRNREYRIEKKYFNCSILIAESPQNCMVWDPLQKNLYSGQQDGKILKWDLSKSKSLEKEDLDFKRAKEKKREMLRKNKVILDDEKIIEKFMVDKKIKNQIKLPGRENVIIENEKSDNVSSIILLDKLQLLAASYLNGNIILWDPLLKDFRKYYLDQNTGVYCMSYDQNKNLLITCGFNHDIFIYDPYIDNTAIYKLKGHNWSINSVVCNVKESEIISLDILGNIKIWDSQNLVNFQTINLNENIELKKNNENINAKKLTSNVKMLYMNKYKKILIYGKKLMLFETDRAENPDLADDELILACYYEKITKTILSFCLRKIKFWNIFTGKLKNVYEDPMGNEITAMAIDRNMKRAFLGDNTGKIKNFNMKNGKLLKELESHNTEITIVVHSLSMNIVVSCSMDNVIKIHDDTELTESEVKKELILSPLVVNAITICEQYKRLAIGLSNGKIRFYDIEHFRYDSDTSSSNTEKLNGEEKEVIDEITCLTQIEGSEIVFSAHGSGKCYFVAGPPSPFKFANITHFENKNANSPTAVCCAVFDYDNHRFFTGDFLGYIKCYDLSIFFEMIEYGNSLKKNQNDPAFILEVLTKYPDIQIESEIWKFEAHKQAIKHLCYVDEEPRILITTSNDLKIKLIDAEKGILKDELKQISCKYKPVPIAIKYLITDPFKSRDEQKIEEKIIERKDLVGMNFQTNQNFENQQINEYSRKITEYNAKEKLLEQIKGVKIIDDKKSNNWNLDIDVDKVKEHENEELKNILNVVKEKEDLIHKTEMIMQTKSIYSDTYKPQFVSQMDEDELHDFSNVLSQKLRQVKLAISKANLSQNKFLAFEQEKKRKELISKNLHSLLYKKKKPIVRTRLSPIKIKNKEVEIDKKDSSKNISTNKNNINEDEENKNDSILKFNESVNNSISHSKSVSKIDKNNLTKNQFLNKTNVDNFKKRKKEKPNLKPIYAPMEIGPVQSSYAFNRNKLLTAADNFEKFKTDFYYDCSEAMKALKASSKKTKISLKAKERESSSNLEIDINNDLIFGIKNK